jgi:hypothetical protein
VSFWHRSCLKSYLISSDVDTDQLPESDRDKRVVHELDRNRIVVGIVLWACYVNAVASFTEDLLLWATSGRVRNSLEIAQCMYTLAT